MSTSIALSPPAWIDLQTRKLAFYCFNQFQEAGLTLEEPQGRFFFGDPEASLQAVIQVNHYRMYRRLLFHGSIGAGESWVDGDWDSPQLIHVIQLFVRNTAVLDRLENKLGWLSAPVLKCRHWFNRNTRAGSRANIAAHYDLGNELYQRILDPLMQYSSAIFPQPHTSLEEAQRYKLKVICDKLSLVPEDHLLEIGSGWGGLACYAAKHYGCRVTTTTVSEAQYEWTKQAIEQAGLEDRVTLLLKDYRDLNGQYDKLVSIEMIESVGHRYFPVYFRTLERLLKPTGRLLIQAITMADQRYEQYRNRVDFIQRYIFPGGCLPSISELCVQLKAHTSMTVVRLNDYSHHYAQTLKLWANQMKSAAGKLCSIGYTEDFQRLWAFYFAYCEGGFREGAIGLVHFEAAKPEAKQCQDGSGFN